MTDQDLLQDLAESYLKSLISKTTDSLDLDNDFDSFAPFGELGIDSFFVLKIVKSLESDFGKLSKTLLFENFNIHDLAAYFVKNHSSTLNEMTSDTVLVAHADEVLTSNTGETKEQNPSNDKHKGLEAAYVTTTSNAVPYLLLEKDAHNHAELGSAITEIFDRYKNESSVSRGTRYIAPNIFIGSERRGFFNYSRCRNIILGYGYTGPEDYFLTLAEEFFLYCESKNYEPNIFYHEQLQLVGDAPFSSTPFGVMQRVLNLKKFKLQGSKMRRLRYQVQKFQKCGECRIEEYICGADIEISKNIAEIVDKWCDARAMVNPLIHIVKKEILEGTLNNDHRIFLTYLDNILQNVILISPMCAEQNGYLMDLEFYPKDMPLGGLEFAITKIIETLVEEGHDTLSLGGTYGVKLFDSSNADPDVDKVLDELRDQNIFSDDGNFQFKNKFRPENENIYLCRAVGRSDPDNIIDIIMMIADPDKMQTPDDENHGPFNDFKTLLKPTSVGDLAIAGNSSLAPDAHNIQKSTNVLQHVIIEGNCHSRTLIESGFNPLVIPNNLVDHDLKTDSWAQLDSPAIDARMRNLRSQLQQSVNIEECLADVFPFKYFALTESGQTAETALAEALGRKEGSVLQNLLFPSWIFTQIGNGLSPEEIPVDEVFKLNSDEVFRSNINIEKLISHLSANSSSIAFVCIEVNDNAAGGYPVSIENLTLVKQELVSRSIPLILDATRVIENAQRIIENEQGYGNKKIWSVTREILSFADILTVSLAKDFCVNKGGLIATNDEALIKKVQKSIEKHGFGLDLFDRKLIALSIQNKKHIENQVLRRMDLTRYVWRALKDEGLPVVSPAGAHCVLIDVKQIDEFNEFNNPIASFVAWLYLNTGIRVGEHSVGMQKGSSLNGLVRLAIPLGLKRDECETLVAKLIRAFSKKQNIPDLDKYSKMADASGNIQSTYTLKAYRNLFGSLMSEPAVEGLAAKSMSGSTPSQRSAHANAPSENESLDNQPNRVQKEEDPIAIVGIAGRYPKANNMEEMWNNLVEGKDCISDIPDERFKRRRQSTSNVKYRGGFIDGVDKFDSLFFNISPREAETLDPQERLFLEVVWEALEDAGYYPEILTEDKNKRDVGVFVGAVWAMYQTLGAEERLAGKHVISSSFLWSVANRVSSFMNLSGPSLAVDTACSSSLTAIYLACEALKKGECSSAIVGGVNLDVHQCKHEITVAGGLLSEDGICRTFGSGANGYVPGEGVGAILLKPLSKAVIDKDNIYGVIKSVAVNHGGRTSGYSVPNPKAQEKLVSKALSQVDMDARTLGYIEAHGTGTELGDPIEITGLTNAFEAYGVENQSCAIGSVKTNIGHLEAAAGIAGVSKVLLQMRNRKMVPSLHSSELNEHIDFSNSPFLVQQSYQEWNEKEVDGVRYPLRAGVSSFGAGGSNAHVIIEQYKNAIIQEHEETGVDIIFPVSARTEEQLREAATRLKGFLKRDAEKEQSDQSKIADVAFTLQVGRKSFDHRLVLVAKTKPLLIEKLTHFIEGKKDDAVLVGNLKNSEGITKLLNRKEKEEFISLLSQGRDATKLAKLWIDGVLADWQGRFSQSEGRRVSLPTYPFADKRHWITDAASFVGDGASSAATIQSMHPLIDSNESTFERQVFKKTFTEHEFFIYDHLVSDIPTLPGVAYLDFARKAGELALGRKVQKIKNIVWVSPLTVENSTPNEVFIELKPSGDSVRFEVFSEQEEGRKQLYSQGKLSYATDDDLSLADEYIDIESIRARTSKVIEGKDAYPLFKGLGLHLGHSFQVLQEVFKNEDEVLAALSIPQIPNSQFSDYILHPSLVDGSFQALMAAKLAGDASGEMVVPYSLGEVEILHPLTPKCYSYVVDAAGQKKANSNLSKKNVFILDEKGKILVRVRDSVGVALTEVHEKPSDKGAKGDEDEFSKLYYSVVWEEKLLVEEVLGKGSDQYLILFANDDSFSSKYDNGSVFLVKPGNKFESISENTCSVRVKNKDDLAQLFDLFESRGISAERICFAWGDTFLKDEKNYSASHLDMALHSGVYSYLMLCQTLIERKREAKTQLLYVFHTDGQAQPQNEAINGFHKILKAESPKLRCKSVEICLDDSASTDHVSTAILNAVSNEFSPASQGALAIRYSDNIRQEQTIREFDLETTRETESSSSLALKEKGVYIITGGVGGLGLIFAEFLAQTCRARLVLTGRSELSFAREARLEELKQLGAEVLYISTDVSKLEDVQSLIQETKSRFGSINGIVHSAGVLRDSYIRNKTLEEMEAVFAPKLHGALHLDEETKNEDLDFFVLFSSLAALAGNAGQSDYSFANHFMDVFSRKREMLKESGERKGKTLSINWSLWADGGMQLDEQTEQFFRKNLGINALSVDTGLETFIKGLSSSKASFAVIEGVQDKIERAWGLIEEPEPKQKPVETALKSSSQSNTQVAAVPVDQSGSDDLTLAVQTELGKIVMEFLKLDAEDVDWDSILLDLGFDSIGLTTFANAVNDKYGLDVTPVLFFEYTNIREIGTFIASVHRDAVEAVHQSGAASSGTQATSTNPTDAESAGSVPAIVSKAWNPLAEAQQLVQASTNSFSPERRFIEKPIAVVGMSGVMPQSDNLDEFWENLRNAKDTMVTEIPKDRWNWEDYYGDPETEENKTKSKWGGFMRQVDKFDPHFWGISSREAEMMDPQQRIFLETVWKAVEDSGQKVSDLAGTKTGLFVGAATRDYTDLMGILDVEVDEYAAPGTSHAILANRVSFLLGLHGPSAPIDTACSSSLVAIHRALESLHTGSSEMAIVGGVQVMLTPAAFISFGAAGLLSDDGKTRTFDEAGNGYVRGEGCGAIFLKPLEKAEAEGNHIYAVIRGTAENHGGRATMLTAPNPTLQAELLVEAYTNAELDPTTIGYIECHGTGTSLGDSIEVQAMRKAFSELYRKNGKATAPKPHIGLSSVKSNIGHLETAAGISGVLKLLLAMKHKQIPAILHFEKLNSYINLDSTPFYMVEKTQAWEPIYDKNGNALPRRAGVSSFGFGGANAHIIFEEYLGNPNPPANDFQSPYLVVLSAKNKERLKAYAQDMLNFVDKNEVGLPDFTYTLQVGRDEMSERLALVASDIDELKKKLFEYIQIGEKANQIFQNNVQQNKGRFKTLIEGAAGKAFLEALVEQRDLAKLAELWVSGVVFDWSLFYGKGLPRRISIPPYPFAKERCWPEGKNNVSDSGISTATALHPLLHKNTSDLLQQSYSSQFGESEFFLKDYTLLSYKVLSSSAYLEMARAAVEHAMPGVDKSTQIELRNIVWSKPLLCHQTAPVNIALFANDNEHIDYEVYTAEGDIDIVYFQGQAALGEQAKQKKHAIKSLQENMKISDLNVEDIYIAYRDIGLDYGPGFQCLDELYIGENQLLAKVHLPKPLSAKQGEYVLHPSLLEAAIQACLGFKVGLEINLELTAGQPLLPVSIQVLRCIELREKIAFIFVRYSDKHKGKLDIDLCDEQGRIGVQLLGLELKVQAFDVLQEESSEVSEVAPIISVDVYKFYRDQSAANGTVLELSVEEKTKVFVQQLMANQLKAAADDIDMDCHLMDAGITSIGMAEMTQSIKEYVDPDFSPAAFFECSTPQDFSTLLSKIYENVFSVMTVSTTTQKIVGEVVSSEIKRVIPKSPLVSGKTLKSIRHSNRGRLFNVWTPNQDRQNTQVETKIPLHIEDAQSDLPISNLNNVPIGYDDVVRGVMVTGATGFLGVHILAELLDENPEVTAYCLVRANSDEHALQRLKDQAAKFEILIDECRIHVLCGDINKHQLGLADDDWLICTDNIQQIIHASAHVNHIEGYATFRDATRGMKEIIRLAGTGKRKLIHFMSSIAACARKAGDRMSMFENEIFIQDGESVFGGYGQSKWAQETLLRRANELGIPYAIYRFGELSGSSKTGLGQADDMLHRLLQMRFAIGCREKISNDVLDMVPIDIAAKLVVKTVFTSEIWNTIVHATHPKPFPMPYVYKSAEDQGLKFEAVSKARYLEKCNDYIKYAASINSVDGFVLECVLRDFAGSSKNMTMVDGYFAVLFPFEQRNFTKALKITGIHLPDWRELLALYFTRWNSEDSGYMAKVHGYKTWLELKRGSSPTKNSDDNTLMEVLDAQ